MQSSDKFYIVYDWMTDLRGGAQRDVFALLYSYADEQGMSSVSQSVMSRRLGYDKRKIIRIIQELVKLGAISIKERGVGQSKKSVYQILKGDKISPLKGDKISPLKGDKISPLKGDKISPHNNKYYKKDNACNTIDNANSFPNVKEFVGGRKNAPPTPSENEPQKTTEKKISKTTDIETRAKDFYDALIPYLDKYPPELLRAFYDYWSEPTKSRKKMRWELEKTWDTARRLATWQRKDDEIKNRQNYDKRRTNNESKVHDNWDIDRSYLNN